MNASADLLPLLTQLALKASLLLALTLGIGALLTRLSAARRYVLWLAVTLACVALPFGLFLLPSWQILPTLQPNPFFNSQEEIIVQNPVIESAPIEASSQATPDHPSSISSPVTTTSSTPQQAVIKTVFAENSRWDAAAWKCLLVGFWLVGSSFMLLRLAWGLWRLRKLRHELEPLDLTLPATIQDSLRQAGLRLPARVYRAPADAVPMVWGLLHPHLLLPAGAEQWSEDRLQAVLLHELTHLQRRDPLALGLAQVMQALHWFNPLAWLTLHRLRFDQERACDDAVLRQGVRASEYAQHLLELSRHAKLAPGLGLCALAMASPHPAPVERRITSILDPRRARQPASRSISMLLVSLSLIIVLPLAMLQALEAVKLRGRIVDRHGAVMALSSEDKKRFYPTETAASHIVGFTGKPALAEQAFKTLSGRDGIERTADEALNQGKDVALTLDLRMQQAAHRAMQQAGITRGSLVILNPQTGEVLVSLSLPLYDNNDFVTTPSKETWQRYVQDRETPLLNRSIRNVFVSGVTAMISTALAGATKDLQGRVYECQGSVTYGSRRLGCAGNAEKSWQPHGPQTLAQALTHTCSCYFYRYGNETGAQDLLKMNQMLGLDQKTGIELDRESESLLPRPDLVPKWTNLDTARMASGQGLFMITPMHMARAIAAVATGKTMKLRLLHSPESTPQVLADLTSVIPTERLQQVREALLQATQARLPTQPGTTSLVALSQTLKMPRRNADQVQVQEIAECTVGYAPADQPQLAFALLAENVKPDQNTGLPLAQQLLSECLTLTGAGSQGPHKSSLRQETKARVESAYVDQLRDELRRTEAETQALQQHIDFTRSILSPPASETHPFKAMPMKKNPKVDWTPRPSSEA